MLLPKNARRLGGLSDVVISLYAGGMTVRDISHHLHRVYGTEVSPDTISTITDEVLDEVKAWQTRPLDEVYPIVYIDALMVKVRDGGTVRNKACYLVVGVDCAGVKRVLGIWVQQSEGAKFWGQVCTELRNRGVRDVLIACCDGLNGLPEAIETIWPHTTVQTCTVHLIRAAMKFVSYKDRREMVAALKEIYTASSIERRRDRPARLRRLTHGQALPRRGRDLGTRLGTVHPVPGLPTRPEKDHLHDQRHREF